MMPWVKAMPVAIDIWGGSKGLHYKGNTGGESRNNPELSDALICWFTSEGSPVPIWCLSFLLTSTRHSALPVLHAHSHIIASFLLWFHFDFGFITSWLSWKSLTQKLDMEGSLICYQHVQRGNCGMPGERCTSRTLWWWPPLIRGLCRTGSVCRRRTRFFVREGLLSPLCCLCWVFLN